MKQKQYCYKFNKDLKNGPYKKKVEHRITTCNSTLKDAPKRSENMFSQKFVQKMFIAALFIISKKWK